MTNMTLTIPDADAQPVVLWRPGRSPLTCPPTRSKDCGDDIL
jgi:hypothetical protein